MNKELNDLRRGDAYGEEVSFIEDIEDYEPVLFEKEEEDS